MNELQQKLLAAFQVEHRDHLEAVRVMLDRLEQSAWDLATIDLVELHRRVHSLKGAARAVDLRPVEILAHRLEDVIARCQEGGLVLDAALSRSLSAAMDAIEDWVAALGDGRQTPSLEPVISEIDRILGGTGTRAEMAPASPADREPEPNRETDANKSPVQVRESVRVDAASLDGLLQCSDEILAATARQSQLVAELSVLERATQSLARDFSGLLLDRAKAAEARRLAPRALQAKAVQDLDARVQELAKSVRTVAHRQNLQAWRVRQLGERLDAQMRHVRMTPARDVFGNVRKMVRDLARDLGKSVRVEARGLEMLADRGVLQGLKDPVLHLLRNAVVHGVEPPEERRAKGKPPEGLVRLEIAAQGSRLLLRVEDDGHGIDVEGIRRAALTKGLLTAEQAARLDVNALTALLVQPGVSTARRVDELSGRGVGLSIVAEALTRLQGDLSIRLRPDGGTLVLATAPISVSSRHLLVVRCRGETFAIPALGVERLLRISRDQVQKVEGRSVLLVEDKLPLPLVPLTTLLGKAGGGAGVNSKLLVAVLKSGEARLGAIVDELVMVLDGLIRELGVAGAASEFAAGGVVLEDGRVSPVLNVTALVAAGGRPEADWHLAPAAGEEQEGAHSILVVDDSITTRTLEKSILEANGYRVRLSVDGADALNQLRREQVDLVIADIEMPGVDGFGLLKAMKEDERLHSTPVILVTSRDNAEDKREGLRLGADAYVVKQRFDQRELLEVIGQLL